MSSVDAARIAAFGVPDDAVDDVRVRLPGVQLHAGVRSGDLHGLPPGTIVLLADGPVASPDALGTTETLGCVRRGMRIVATGGAGLLRALEIAHPGIRGCGPLFDLLDAHLVIDLRWLVPALGHEGLSLAELQAAHWNRVGGRPSSTDELEQTMQSAALRDPSTVAHAKGQRRARAVDAARGIAEDAP
jgi:hypothetical protein